MLSKNVLYALCLFFLLTAQAINAIVWLERPEDFQPRFEIAACFFERDDHQFLFLHRMDNKSQGNSWGIPGGKREKGEPILDTLVREIKEETGITLNPECVKSLGTVYITNTVRNKVSYLYHMFSIPYNGSRAITINPEEHKGFTWVSLKDALKLPLMDDEDICLKLCYPELTKE